MSEWISIKDKLPEDESRVLTTIKTAQGSIGIDDCYYFEDVGFCLYSTFEIMSKLGITVIAWMHMPEPYEGD